jgi:hypothetical protein
MPPATPKQRVALQKAAATKKQKAHELRIRRQCEQEQRERKKHERKIDKEFMDIIDDLCYDDSKYDKAKVMTEVLQDACDHCEEHHPLLSLCSAEGVAILHSKRCELAHAKMKEYHAEKARLRRKRRRGISFR